MWRRECGESPRLRHMIFPDEWDQLCDLALKGLEQPPEATPWMPTAEQPNFDQRALKAEIAKIWGEHGAHAEVYRMLLRDAARYWWLRNANSIMPGAPGKRPIEWYCGTDADEAIDKAIASSSGPQETRS
jgi:hypothetical protein